MGSAVRDAEAEAEGLERKVQELSQEPTSLTAAAERLGITPEKQLRQLFVLWFGDHFLNTSCGTAASWGFDGRLRLAQRLHHGK